MCLCKCVAAACLSCVCVCSQRSFCGWCCILTVRLHVPQCIRQAWLMTTLLMNNVSNSFQSSVFFAMRKDDGKKGEEEKMYKWRPRFRCTSGHLSCIFLLRHTFCSMSKRNSERCFSFHTACKFHPLIFILTGKIQREDQGEQWMGGGGGREAWRDERTYAPDARNLSWKAATVLAR